jgi:hypothetical protein
VKCHSWRFVKFVNFDWGQHLRRVRLIKQSRQLCRHGLLDEHRKLQPHVALRELNTHLYGETVIRMRLFRRSPVSCGPTKLLTSRYVCPKWPLRLGPGKFMHFTGDQVGACIRTPLKGYADISIQIIEIRYVITKRPHHQANNCTRHFFARSCLHSETPN